MIQDVDRWIAELKAAGWVRHATNSEIWIAPSGGWYRGPFKAWQIMKEDEHIQAEERQSGVDIMFEGDIL